MVIGRSPRSIQRHSAVSGRCGWDGNGQKGLLKGEFDGCEWMVDGGLGVQEKDKVGSGSLNCSRHCSQQPKRRQYYKNGAVGFRLSKGSSLG